MGINKEYINKFLLVILVLISMGLLITAFILGIKFTDDETELGHQLIDTVGGYLLK